jgi:hypothetical protein
MKKAPSDQNRTGQPESYQHSDAAISALTSRDLNRLWGSARRRMEKLRGHEGTARAFARQGPEDLVAEAIRRIKSGSRRTKPRHLANKEAFLNFIQGVMSSIANNFVRHAEPYVPHLPVGDAEFGLPFVDPLAAETVERDVRERELLRHLIPELRDRVAGKRKLVTEVTALERALNSERTKSASDLVYESSPQLLNHLRGLLIERGIVLPDIYPPNSGL